MELVVWAIVYFFLGPLLYAERSNRTFVFIEAAMIMRVVGKMKLAILVGSIAIWKKQSKHLQKFAGNF